VTSGVTPNGGEMEKLVTINRFSVTVVYARTKKHEFPQGVVDCYCLLGNSNCLYDYHIRFTSAPFI